MVAGRMTMIDIAKRLGIDGGPGVWIFGDCVVVEQDDEYDSCPPDYHVYMLDEQDRIRRQTVTPWTDEDSEQCRNALNGGESPVGVWEDGNGGVVCPLNGEEVDE